MSAVKRAISVIWFPILIVVILVVFFFHDRMVAIYMTIAAMALFVISMIPFKKLLYNRIESSFFINYMRIDHIEYALKTNIRPLEGERKMSQMVDSKIMKGRVFFAKPLYVYVHPDVITEVKSFLSQKVDMKQITAYLIENYKFKSKKEIEALIENIKD